MIVDNLLLTQVVLGVNDKELQSKLLREDLPLIEVKQVNINTK